MNSLFIFISSEQDSYPEYLLSNESKPFVQPLLKNYHFDQIFLLHSREDRTEAESQLELLLRKAPEIQITTREYDISANSSFQKCINHLLSILNELLKNAPGFNSFFLINSNLPYIRSACLHLLTSKQIEGILLSEPTQASPNLLMGYKFKEIDITESHNKNFHTAFEPQSKFIDDILKEIDLIGSHPKFKRVIELAEAIAPHEAPVLIQGKTGTGKEGVAKLIHQLSKRSQHELVTVNCASLPETLAESILFGHVRGSFTGAHTAQEGKFSQAHNSTLFLDEIGELSLKIQAQLLRVLEDGYIDTIGARRTKKVNVRVIAATNRDLKNEIRLGNFREDLFFRLRVGEIHLPLLDERRSDIPKIASHILNKINQNLAETKNFSPEAIEFLCKESWSGNIRDLKNTIERGAIFSKTTTIYPRDFLHESIHILDTSTTNTISTPYVGFSLEKYLTDIRKTLIVKAIEKSRGNQSKAAKLLGITPQAINKFIKHQKPKEIDIN